jgi:hypothetical protein
MIPEVGLSHRLAKPIKHDHYPENHEKGKFR